VRNGASAAPISSGERLADTWHPEQTSARNASVLTGKRQNGHNGLTPPRRLLVRPEVIADLLVPASGTGIGLVG